MLVCVDGCDLCIHQTTLYHITDSILWPQDQKHVLWPLRLYVFTRVSFLDIGDAWRRQTSRRTLEAMFLTSVSALVEFWVSYVELWTVRYARANVVVCRTSFVLAYIEIYVFRGNPLQAHSLEQSYHPTQPFEREKYNTKWKL